MITGKLEVTIKINSLPQPKTVENGWQEFQIDCDGRVVTIVVKPKMWKKLTDAQANWESWVAAITGTIGETTEDGFVLNNPSIQTFEKKSKQSEAVEAAT
ncbi:MAG: fertility inhibition FinO-like protein [Stigonema ocellatum SAG 48.90 = DSM 106950]|nr:fertility inhibition FinO-like protein [Stigonema ocellatum SAG 48.90 = DSM 106950]